MRNIVINSLGILIWVMGALILVGGVISGVNFMQFDAITGIGVMVGSVLSAIIFCGMFFMFLDIRDSTKRTAAAMEKLANK